MVADPKKGLLMHIPIVFPVALAASAIATPPAAFPHNDEAPTTRIKVSDLDLASAAGRNDLDRRIRGAAAKLCEPLAGSLLSHHRCVDETIASVSAVRNRLISSARFVATATDNE